MILWLDAHISPKLVPWIHDTFGMDVLHVRDLGLREAEDPDIFYKAREADAIVITKDRDFVELLGRLGPPPKIIWITCGNTSNARQAQAMGHDRVHWALVTFVQRFGSSLNLNPHMHVLMLDGVYVDGEDAPVFLPAPPLSERAAGALDHAA